MSTLIWPNVAKPLGLSDQERSYLEKFINVNSEKIEATRQKIHAPAVVIGPNTVLLDAYANDSDPSARTSPCRRIYHLPNDILVDANELVGEGSQTKAFKYYSPKSGKFYVLKTLPTDRDEAEIARTIYNRLKGKPGCVSYYYIDKNLVIEPCYDSTLKHELLQENLKTTAVKVNVLAKLAIGMKSIHTTKYPMTWGGTRVQRFVGPLSHRDLQPANIFASRESQGESPGLRVDIGDYGYVGASHQLICSQYHMSPQLAQIALNEHESKTHNVHFNNYLGVQNDIWQLGLIFFSVLKNRLIDDGNGGGLPPLKCLEETMNCKTKQQAKIVVSLTQKDIDEDVTAEIDAVSASTLPENEKYTLKKCWKIVGQMLQVEARKRIYIEKIEKKLVKAADLKE